MLLVLVVDGLEAMADHGLAQEPKVGKLGEEWTRVPDCCGVGDEGDKVGEYDETDDGSDEVGGRGERPCKRIAQLANEICLNHGDKGQLGGMRQCR